MGTKQRDLMRSFELAIRSLLAPCSFQEFCEALPGFTSAEQERLHRIFTQVMSSLHGNVEAFIFASRISLSWDLIALLDRNINRTDEFRSICLETQVENAMDTVEQLVEEQSGSFDFKTNVMDVAHNMSTATKNEIQYSTEMPEKEEVQNHLKRERIELLKRGRADMSDVANAVEKLRSGIASYGMHDSNRLHSP